MKSMPLMRLSNMEQFAAINLLSDPGHIGGPVIVPSCAQIILEWTLLNGKVARNVMYGRYSGPFAGSVAQCNSILAGIIAGTPWSTLAAFMNPTVGPSFVTMRNVAVKDQPLIQSTAAGAPGTSTGSPLPDEVAAVVTLRTAKSGRANRGRLFIPNWASNAVAPGNVIAGPAVTALGVWAQNIPSAFSANGYSMVLGQPARAAYIGTTGTHHDARDATSELMTSLSVRDNHWDTNRRRGLR